MGETQTIDHRSEGRAFRAVLQARLLDALGDAVIATDLGGKIVFWNRAAEGLFGWPAEEVLGRTITEVTPAEQSREQAREIMECLTRGEQWQGDILLGRRLQRLRPALRAVHRRERPGPEVLRAGARARAVRVPLARGRRALVRRATTPVRMAADCAEHP